MKPESEITVTRDRIIAAVGEFGERYDLPAAGDQLTAREIQCMAMGALAFADDMLQLDRPPNLSRLINAMEKDNEGQATWSYSKR